ncbi:uncharacterized protein [Rutidosis leptorrhynchoides]|uniref:uncharacterized protein n=1 Tax=Rutidosis leptorrhynchoides TaxID=125765 RepID=UPI003A99B49B
MVAISIYKGNLHRAPDSLRQWLMPTRKISLKDFKTLLHRRSKALSRLHSTDPTTSNPNPNPNPNSIQPYSDQIQPLSDGTLQVIVNDVSELKVDDENTAVKSENVDNHGGGDSLCRELVTVNESNDEEKVQVESGDQIVLSKDDTIKDKEKRKKDVEEKLKVLNERKHKLVQVLKQILHAEEVLRTRSNAHGVTGRPSVSLQVDVGNDSALMSRHVTPCPGSDGADVEGVDTDDVSNQNTHFRNLTRINSVSPSSDSLHRRHPFSMVPNPSRGSLGVVASSPSRFAPTPTATPTGQQGNLPTVSVTGTNYVASSPSPSPAGSGGTSIFRDARLPSPWN